MFKLLNFSLRNHSQLKDISIDFVNNGEENNIDKPYTSVLIGSNGVGKSQILRAISEIFREFETHQKTESRWTRGFNFSLTFKVNKDVFTIRSGKFTLFDREGPHNLIEAYKNLPEELYTFKILDLNKPNPYKSYQINIAEVVLPNKLLVSSIMLNDRFAFANSNPSDFYQYLGIRRSASQTSTLTFARKTIRYLFDAARTSDYKNNLADLLEFMGLDKSLKVSYTLKYKPVFERNDADIETFHKFFNGWWEVQGVRRSKDNKLWGKWYYDKIKDDTVKIEKLLRLLNTINKKLTAKLHSKRSKEYIINVFSETQDFDDFSLIEELVYLDLLGLEGIRIRKKNIHDYGVESSSSGEYHLLLSLLGLFSRIEQSSLVLIDEPEISLHPNWQMRYINELKKMFQKYSDCHFIIASHSHFLVSDLEGKSSAVIAFQKDEENKIHSTLIDTETFGWSAEEILYNIFSVRTTRNYYLEVELRELLHKIAIKSDEVKRMTQILENVKRITLSSNDPLNLIIQKAEDYLNDKANQL